MQTALLVLLLAMVAWAVVSYCFGGKRPWHIFQYDGKAALLILVLVLIPFVIRVLRTQAGAKQELAELGITPYPALEESSGIATGIRVAGDRVWVFHADDEPDAILAYYRDPETRPGWDLNSESSLTLSLRRGAQRLTIAANEQRTETIVMYSLSDAAHEDR